MKYILRDFVLIVFVPLYPSHLLDLDVVLPSLQWAMLFQTKPTITFATNLLLRINTSGMPAINKAALLTNVGKLVPNVVLMASSNSEFLIPFRKLMCPNLESLAMRWLRNTIHNPGSSMT